MSRALAPWCQPDSLLNEAIRLCGDTLVHYFFRTPEEAQEYARKHGAQFIQRKWHALIMGRYDFTNHWTSDTGDEFPNFITATMHCEKKRVW